MFYSLPGQVSGLRVVVIGAGYVGLVSGACLAQLGHVVTCIDLSVDKIEAIARGELPIYEPGLEELIERNVQRRSLSFSTSYDTIPEADVVVVAVGTPVRALDGSADLGDLDAAITEVSPRLKSKALLVIKSTVPVGSGDKIEAALGGSSCNQVAVVSNPEFLREGQAVQDFMHPERIVIGLNEGWPRAVMEELYRPLGEAGATLLFVDRRSAELIKYASNAFLALKISFVNEMADFCEVAGANIHEVVRGMGLDSRIGPKFLNPGPGYGGSCFPKDTRALATSARELGVQLQLVEMTTAVNDQRKGKMAARIVDACEGIVHGRRIGILGLTFKPGTNDMRDAPSIGIIKLLQGMGAHITAYDPVGMEVARPILPEVEYAASPYVAAQEADALVIMTEWDEFSRLDLGKLKRVMRRPIMLDFRNVMRGKDVDNAGIVYTSLGVAKERKSTQPVPADTNLSVLGVSN